MKKKRVSPGAVDRELLDILEKLEASVDRLPRKFEYLINPGKHLFVTYLQGILYGLGALTAIAILVPVILWTLHRVAWVPIIGEFVSKIATQVEQMNRR